MPIALILTIYPQEQASVPPHLNRATHAALLHLIAEADADLAQRLHDDDRSKPFTVSNVLGLPTATPRGTPVTVTPAQRYELRTTHHAPRTTHHTSRTTHHAPRITWYHSCERTSRTVSCEALRAGR